MTHEELKKLEESFDKYKKALSIVYADGDVTTIERNRLVSLKNELGLSDSDCMAMEARFHKIADSDVITWEHLKTHHHCHLCDSDGAIRWNGIDHSMIEYLEVGDTYIEVSNGGSYTGLKEPFVLSVGQSFDDLLDEYGENHIYDAVADGKLEVFEEQDDLETYLKLRFDILDIEGIENEYSWLGLNNQTWTRKDHDDLSRRIKDEESLAEKYNRMEITFERKTSDLGDGGKLYSFSEMYDWVQEKSPDKDSKQVLAETVSRMVYSNVDFAEFNVETYDDVYGFGDGAEQRFNLAYNVAEKLLDGKIVTLEAVQRHVHAGAIKKFERLKENPLYKDDISVNDRINTAFGIASSLYLELTRPSEAKERYADFHNCSNEKKKETIIAAMNRLQKTFENKNIIMSDSRKDMIVLPDSNALLLEDLEALIKGRDAVNFGKDSLSYIRPDAEQLQDGIENGWGWNSVTTGYREASSSTIKAAVNIEKIDDMDVFEHDSDAAKQYGIDHDCRILEEKKDIWIGDEDNRYFSYPDTPENREALKEYVIEHPFSFDSKVFTEEQILSFTNDIDKMRDFDGLSKYEFLSSYGYITEEEYDATAKELKEQGRTGNQVFKSLCYKEALDYLNHDNRDEKTGSFADEIQRAIEKLTEVNISSASEESANYVAEKISVFLNAKDYVEERFVIVRPTGDEILEKLRQGISCSDILKNELYDRAESGIETEKTFGPRKSDDKTQSLKEPVEIIKEVAGLKELAEVPELFKAEFRNKMKSHSTSPDPFVAARSILKDWQASKPDFVPVLNGWLKEQGCTSEKGFEMFFNTINGPEQKKGRNKADYIGHERD